VSRHWWAVCLGRTARQLAIIGSSRADTRNAPPDVRGRHLGHHRSFFTLKSQGGTVASNTGIATRSGGRLGTARSACSRIVGLLRDDRKVVRLDQFSIRDDRQPHSINSRLDEQFLRQRLSLDPPIDLEGRSVDPGFRHRQVTACAI